MKLINSRHDYPELLSRINQLDDPSSALRDLCRGDLFFLIRYMCGRADMEHDFLFERCREVQARPDGMLDLWSREHYKSTIITFGLTIQEILNNQEITIGIFSHTRPIAKAFLRQIKREFELNAKLKALFPEILYDNPAKQAMKWSEDDGIIVKRASNPKEATIEAYGVVDGQPTSKHYSLLIYDDIVTRESVSNPEMIEKTTDALALSYNLGAQGGRRRFIGTRYHFADTYRTIMERGTAIPRIYSATHNGSIDGDPVFLSREILEEKRRDVGPFVYSCQMLQNPIADNSQGFKREWINRFSGEKIEGANWYLLVDAANGKRKNNDYTSIWAVGLGGDGNYYCIPEVRDRLNLTERTARVIALHRKYKPVEIRYERYGMMADVEYILAAQNKINYRFPIIEVGGTMGKIDRIKRMVPLFENSKIYIPHTHTVTDYEGKSRDNAHIFIEDEYAAFPVSLHDDMLDALSRICDVSGRKNGIAVDLALQWPGKNRESMRPFLEPFSPSVSGMGY